MHARGTRETRSTTATTRRNETKSIRLSDGSTSAVTTTTRTTTTCTRGQRMRFLGSTHTTGPWMTRARRGRVVHRVKRWFRVGVGTYFNQLPRSFVRSSRWRPSFVVVVQTRPMRGRCVFFGVRARSRGSFQTTHRSRRTPSTRSDDRSLMNVFVSFRFFFFRPEHSRARTHTASSLLDVDPHPHPLRGTSD